MTEGPNREASNRTDANGHLRGMARICIDGTHLSRRVSGIERITKELFSQEALAPLPVEVFRSNPRRAIMAFRQMVVAPLSAFLDPKSLWLFSGYPPSPLFSLIPERTVHYVHDLFQLTRSQEELNLAARIYMRPSFRRSVRRLRYFLVNSLTTKATLASFTRPDAEIRPFRPEIRNVFGLEPRPRAESGGPLVVGALGTVQPRKNFVASARICESLAAVAGRPVELHIIGRRGWGPDFETLRNLPHVTLHGYLPAEAALPVIQRFDIFLATSRDEGLGLPMLEVQHGAIPVIAPDLPVFRETLGGSAVLVNPDTPEVAARRIAELLAQNDWRGRMAEAALANVARWNAAAAGDRDAVHTFLAERLAVLGRGREANRRLPVAPGPQDER